MCSEYVQSVFKMCSECVQSVFRVCSECVQSVFRVGSGLLVKIGCQYWLSKLVVKILVIVSSSASSVMFWHFFIKGIPLK